MAPVKRQPKPGEFDPEVIELAREVIQQSKTSIMLAYRFFDLALWHMDLEPAAILKPIETNGRTLWFNPILVLRRFKEDPNELIRDILHSTVHCLLRQPFDATHENNRAWWLACDVATEAMVLEMASDIFPCKDDEARRSKLQIMRTISDVLTPERLYTALDQPVRILSATLGQEDALLKELEFLYARDSHGHWPKYSPEGKKRERNADRPEEEDDENTLKLQGDQARDSGGSSGSDDQDDREDEEESAESNVTTDAQEDETPSDPGDGDEDSDGEAADDQPQEDPDADRNDEDQSDEEEPSSDEDDPLAAAVLDEDLSDEEASWEEISKKLQQDLETFSRKIGKHAGTLLANVTLANRKQFDYSDFLRRFVTLHEDMHINNDEFDYIFYTYGMDHYDKMPLIEPLEYQETSRVRDFVIAIDTSGSCSGELVQNFIDRTFQILSQSDEFGERTNIHLIQCDAAIQDDMKIESLSDISSLGDSFQVKGFGGTDFRPVFDYVDKLIDEGEFKDLKGLIYFTDGYGDFPNNGPDYDTAFIFVENKGDPRNVPPWAMKVVLDDKDLKVL